MLSSKSWILFGVIALVAVVVIWKFWKKPPPSHISTQNQEPQKQILNDEKEVETPQPPPPMVFAVNDQGNFDLTDMSGKLLNIGFGRNPKTYINLLDQAEKDIQKNEATGQMTSTVGYTKSYEIAGQRYIVNFTRLT